MGCRAMRKQLVAGDHEAAIYFAWKLGERVRRSDGDEFIIAGGEVDIEEATTGEPGRMGFASYKLQRPNGKSVWVPADELEAAA
jgi:hypothetical protein